jgi:hypothetical protein
VHLSYLWDHFNDLTYGLRANGVAPVMASWGDIRDWCEVCQLSLEVFEIKAIARLCYARAMVSFEDQAKRAKEMSDKARNGNQS